MRAHVLDVREEFAREYILPALQAGAIYEDRYPLATALGRLGSIGTFGWGGAATTTFSVNPAEDIAIVIMGQVMPNDGDLLQKVETLVYQALIDTP